MLGMIEQRSQRPPPSALHMFDCSEASKKKRLPHIPIKPSLQHLKLIEYDVVDGRTIPNLGERLCMMSTENGGEARPINLQMADVHKALFSLRRCADMGFEGKFCQFA